MSEIEKRIDFENHLNVEMYILDKQLHFVSVVDTRASMLLAANLGHTAIVISLIDFARWPSIIIGVLNLIGIVASTAFTYLAVRPSGIDIKEPDNLIYWGHTSRKKRNEYLKDVLNLSTEKVLLDFANEIYTVSTFVRAKYRNMKLAMDIFALSISLTLIFAILKILGWD